MTSPSRHPIRVAILALFSLTLLACQTTSTSPPTTQRTWSEPFFFIQMTDPQFGMHSGNKDFAKETELFTRAIADANRLHPAFVVITGDLVNKDNDPAQIAEFKRISATLNPAIGLYLVPGNHDVGQTPTTQSINNYRQAQGKDYYSFDFRGCHFIALDSTVLHTPTQVPTQLRDQLTWLQADLQTAAAAQPQHIIIFTHHPLFVDQPNEPDSYHNLPTPRRQELLKLFHQYHVQWVFAGHLHRTAAGQDGTLHMVTAGPIGKALGKDPSGFNLIKIYADRVEPTYLGLDQVPARVNLEQ